MKDSKKCTRNYCLFIICENKKVFFEDNALKNPAVFVLLSQKMKIIS